MTDSNISRNDAISYVSYAVDDALSPRDPSDMPDNARLVGWQCGFEPMFVAVWSYLDVRLEDQDAEEIAADYLAEIRWFSDGPISADYII